MENKKLDTNSLVVIGGKEYDSSNFSLVPKKNETSVTSHKTKVGPASSIRSNKNLNTGNIDDKQNLINSNRTGKNKAPRISNNKSVLAADILRETKRAVKKSLDTYDSSGNATLKVGINLASGTAKAYKTVDKVIDGINELKKIRNDTKTAYVKTSVDTYYDIRINNTEDKKVSISKGGTIKEYNVSSLKEEILNHSVHQETIRKIKRNKSLPENVNYSKKNSYSFERQDQQLNVDIYTRNGVHRAHGTKVNEMFTDNVTGGSKDFSEKSYAEFEESFIPSSWEQINNSSDFIDNRSTELVSFEKNFDEPILVKTQVSKTGSIDIQENINISTATLYKNNNKAFVRTAVGKGTKALIKSGIKAGIRTGVNTSTNAFANADDLGCQTIALGIKGTQYSLKGIKAAPKVVEAMSDGIKTGVNVGVKTGKVGVNSIKTVAKGAKLVSDVGVKQASKVAGKALIREGKAALAKAGNSVVSFALNTLKKLGRKLIPLLIVLLLILVFSGMASSFITAVGGTLTPFFGSSDAGEIDETGWLTNKVTAERTVLLNSVKAVYSHNLVAHGGTYHEVRFFNSFSDTELTLTDENILSSMYSVNDYVEYIQPIFHTLILSEYDMNPSSHQMTTTFNDIWNNLSTIKTEILPVEYCEMVKTDNLDGTYTITPTKENDNKVHARYTCPNASSMKYHADNISEPLCSCDSYYYSCNGHEGSCSHSCANDCAGGCTHTHSLTCYLHGCTHTHTSACDKYCGHSCSTWHSASDPGCHNTDYCGSNMSSDCGNSTKHKHCNGYKECLGHKILYLSIDLGDYAKLVKKYFTDEINDLESRPTLDATQTLRLKELKDNYTICMNYLKILEDGFGAGGGIVVDLDGVSLTSVTSYACSFVGNPYVWGGNDPNTGADCSGFVKYVYQNFGVSLPRTARTQVAVGSLVPDITSAQPGDLIFWSDNGTDAGVFHVAMYLGGGKLVHASNSKPYPQGGIKISNVYGTIYKIKRIAHP